MMYSKISTQNENNDIVENDNINNIDNNDFKIQVNSGSVNNNKYSVILPTYNERENLPIILYLIFEMADKNKLNFEVIIVEDNSPDGTAEIAEKLMEIYPNRIILLKRKGKLGLGSAYVDGIKKCTGEFIVLMDADLSHHPKYIPKFIERQIKTNADIVSGSRYIQEAGVYGWTFFRKLTSRVANFLASTTLGVNNTDLTGSFRLYRKPVIERIIGEIISKGYAFQMEILIRANKYGYKIEEVPIVFVERIFGESKLGANEINIFLKGVWKLKWIF